MPDDSSLLLGNYRGGTSICLRSTNPEMSYTDCLEKLRVMGKSHSFEL